MWKMVGKVKSAQGLKGELFVLVFAKEMSWQKKLREFALGAREGTADQVFKVERVRAIKDGMVVKPVGVTDRTQAEKLVGSIFHIPSSMLVSAPGESIFLGEILGFTVFDQGEALGVIEDFSSNGPQDLLVVKGAAQNWEIPFVEPFIENIDFKARSIRMILPEGLLESQTQAKADE